MLWAFGSYDSKVYPLENICEETTLQSSASRGFSLALLLAFIITYFLIKENP